MRIKHRYAFRADGSKKRLVNFLSENEISHNISGAIPMLVFTIYEDDRNWKKVASLMKRHGCSPITECVYSKEELENAAWLSIRSKWRWSYPQPEDHFKSITYDDSKYCDRCGCGLIQKDSFNIKKSPSWGKRNFLMLNWVEDELFINDKVFDLLKNSELKGFDLVDVNYSKNNNVVKNIKQIRVNKILDSGMIIQKDNIKKTIKCKKCGCGKFVLKGRGLYGKEKIFKEIDVDIIKSSEVFGDGYTGSRTIFISNNFYRFITDNGLDKDLSFEAVDLIN